MTMRTACTDVSLCLVVLLCWLGVLGMWRMKEPTQALHYLSLPAAAGSVFLLIGAGLSQGVGEAFWKVAFIAAILMMANSVVTHATARAFRARKLGHWEPREGNPTETVGRESTK